MLNGNVRLVEAAKIVSAFVPVDMETGANNGDWVSLKYFDRCCIVFYAGVGTSGDNPVLTLKQAQDATGTGAKALNFTDIYAQVQTALTSSDTVTDITQAAANTYQSGTAGDAAKQRIYCIEVQGSDLDVTNGFDYIQFSVPDTGSNAQLGCALYVLYGARYEGLVAMPSAIT